MIADYLGTVNAFLGIGKARQVRKPAPGINPRNVLFYGFVAWLELVARSTHHNHIRKGV